MRHKHADLIHAWADGAEIQMFDGKEWWDSINPTWHPANQYRIKPESKPDFIHKTRIVRSKHYSAVRFEVGQENLRLTFDGETGELKSAEVL